MQQAEEYIHEVKGEWPDSDADTWWELVENQGLKWKDFLKAYYPDITRDPTELFGVLVSTPEETGYYMCVL